MRLVVDASTLVAEALRKRGRELLAHSELDLVVAEAAWSETAHELRRRVAQLVAYGHLEQPTATRVLDEVLATIPTRVTLVPAAVSDPFLEQAYRRVPRDPNDAPTVALALHCGILTADQACLQRLRDELVK